MAKQLQVALELKNPLQIVRIRQMELLTGYSRSSIYRKMAEGSMPQPISLGGRAKGWHARTVLAWLESPGNWQAAA